MYNFFSKKHHNKKNVNLIFVREDLSLHLQTLWLYIKGLLINNKIAMTPTSYQPATVNTNWVINCTNKMCNSGTFLHVDLNFMYYALRITNDVYIDS